MGIQDGKQPKHTAAVHLDRKNNYNVGAAASRTGPLALGNFNRTMQSYGWDRQFRGELKGLMVFGNRNTDSEDALGVDIFVVAD